MDQETNWRISHWINCILLAAVVTYLLMGWL